MSRSERRGRRLRALLLGAFGVGGSLVTGFAGAAEPTQQELMDELRALRAKVEQLEAKQQQQDQQQQQNRDASRPSAKEVDATVNRVQSDADRQSQFLQAQGFTAGYDHG